MARWVGVSTISHFTQEPIAKSEEIKKQWEDLIDSAALNRPDIILLPELSLNGNFDLSKNVKKGNVIEILPEGGEIVNFLSRKSKEHKTYIFVTLLRGDKKGRVYNSAVLFDRNGKVVCVYDKVFPTIGEMEIGISPGKDAKVFKTDFGKVAPMICFDINFRELHKECYNKGAELICFLSAFRGGFLIPYATFENRVFLASSTPGENSVIVDPVGRKLVESSTYRKVIFAKINLDFAILHIDYNCNKVGDLKKKYRGNIQIDTFSPEAIYMISSLHPQKNVWQMIKEFNMETYDKYLDRARRVRKNHLRY